MAKERDVVFLLGAGASAEAGIPVSGEMIRRLEQTLLKEDAWKPYEELYNHVKSAILYKEALARRFDNAATYNIETLVNTLYELERNEEHPLYPFIAAWNARFVSLAGERFPRVREFRLRISELLKQWVCPDDPTHASYYAGLTTAQRALNFPLRLFSLNYDLCVEKLQSPDFVVETGFEGFGPKYTWSYDRFSELERAENPPPQAFLYKVHGSIDWKRDPETRLLSRVEQVHLIPADQMEIIFGREAKLEAADPYLFYAYELRHSALEAKLIVTIGYSFYDPHINRILAQAVERDAQKRVLVVAGVSTGSEDEHARGVSERSGIPRASVQVVAGRASAFLSRPDLGTLLIDAVPQAGSPF